MTVIVTDPAHLKALVAQVHGMGAFAFDVETIPGLGQENQFRLDPRRNEVVWTAIATYGMGFVIPTGHPHGDQNGTTKEPRVQADGRTRNFTVPTFAPAPRQMSRGEVFTILEPLFYDERIVKVGHNVKFDLETVQKYYGNEVQPPEYFDTQIAAHMLDENLRDYKLGSVVKREFGFSYDKSLGEQIEKYGFHAAAKYNFFDAKWTWLLYQKYAPMLEDEGFHGLWKLEMDLLEVLLFMEQQGALLDEERAKEAKHKLGTRLDQIRGELFRLAGGKAINFNSNPQMQDLLYGPKKNGGFGLKSKVKTKGGAASTSQAALEKHRGHPFVDAYLELGEVDKIHGTYLTAYLGGEVVRQTTGKITREVKPSILYKGKLHASFKQHGTVTGRFSCVAADTLIEMPRDLTKFPEGIPITQVRAGDWVYAFDWKRELTLRRVKWVGQTGVKQTVVVKVRNSDGHEKSVRLTPEHLVRMWNGDWRPAGSLMHRHGGAHRDDGPRVMTMGKRTYRVVSVSSGHFEPVWDMEVEEDHNFVANGIVVHNCGSPNLQNIPRPSSELGALIRGLFIAPAGHSLVVADYGQIEYVVMAHLSKDPVLVDAFLDGVDLHQYVAAMVFSKDMEDVSKTERTTAKNTNFAVAYGAGTDKVASMSGISMEAAETFRKAHRKLLPTLYQWTEQTVAEARNQRPPHVRTLLGRKRRLPTLVSTSWYLRSEAERQAVNARVQGSAADLIKLAMVRLHRACDEELRLSLSVHDELVLVVPDDRVDDGCEVMREAMLGPGIQQLLSVPMKIDMQVVKRWSDAKA